MELIKKVKTISRNGFHNTEAINSGDIDFLTQNIKSTDKELVEKSLEKLKGKLNDNNENTY